MHSLTDSKASRARALAARVVPVGVLLLAWELAARMGVVNPYVFPPVSQIVVRWVALIADTTMLGPLWDTLWRALLGLGMAIAVGVPLGLAMGRIRAAEWFLEPLFSFGFPLPKIALIPLYVSWFGLFSLSKVMLIFTDCLFPIVIFTYHGARGVSPVYLWSAQARGTGRVRMFWRVVLPLSLASIYDGIQVAVVVAVLVAVV
jgi:ABC-type nitrate/sulfonate/bicarbonate transport system permease component